MKISGTYVTAAFSLATMLLSAGAATAFGLKDAFVKFEGNTILSLDSLQSLTPGILPQKRTSNGHWVKRKPKVTIRWSPEKRVLKLTISTGCLQSSAGEVSDFVSVSLDRKNLRVQVSGAFWYKIYATVQTRDCTQTHSYERVFLDLEYGAYTLQVGDDPERPIVLGVNLIP